MKRSFTLLMLIILMPICIVGQDQTDTSAEETAILTGNWTIDLRPTPESEGYFQPFVVETMAADSFTGTFYGSTIENAIMNKNWDRLYFAFTTRDQSNEYFHTGYLFNGELYGMTYCPNRSFAAPWLGAKN